MDTVSIYKFVSLLSEFSMIVNIEDFLSMFGMDLGSHLWRKFTIQCSSNILLFWEMLSHENRKKICQELLLNTQRANITFDI